MVSRWLVMPMPVTASIRMPASAAATRATRRVTSQISSASCSTQPGRGKCCVNSLYARPRTVPSRSMTRQVTPVVPSSMARIMGEVER